MAGTSSRGNPSFGDIVRTVGVLGAFVLGLWLVGQLVTVTPDQPTRSVEWEDTAASVARTADFPVLAPEALPKGWRATSVRYDPGVWHLGVVTDDDEYVGLEQVQMSLDRAVDQFAEGSKSSGTVTIDGEEWRVRTGPAEADRTYLREADGLVTLVTGSAGAADLEAYVASLASPAS